jgi:hypothetical protein
LLHDPRPSLLKRLSGSKQPFQLALGSLPEVEEVALTKLNPVAIALTGEE